MATHDSDDITRLLENNRRWAANMERDTPGFFRRLAHQQRPKFLWIGCSDSRVPANQITGLMPGEMFVHCNVANIVGQTDLNCMSVIDFAVRELQVQHIIVCGHYGCGGVKAALEGKTEGAIDHWLSSIRDLAAQHRKELDSLAPAAAQARLSEINVCHQVSTLCRITTLKQAWQRGQQVDVHGWIYSIEEGLIKDLGVRVGTADMA